MFRYFVAAGAVLALSISLVDTIQRSAVTEPQAMAAKPAPQPKASSLSSRLVVIRAENGHFAAKATINGRPVHFIVDTGATVIAIRESDAASIGIRPFPDDYRIPISTANGKGIAAAAELDRVEIDGIEVRGVPAIIVPDSALSVNLLGMSFLARVRWTHEPGKLVLEQ
jgi:aspartyl protease family protein